MDYGFWSHALLWLIGAMAAVGALGTALAFWSLGRSGLPQGLIPLERRHRGVDDVGQRRLALPRRRPPHPARDARACCSCEISSDEGMKCSREPMRRASSSRGTRSSTKTTPVGVAAADAIAVAAGERRAGHHHSPRRVAQRRGDDVEPRHPIVVVERDRRPPSWRRSPRDAGRRRRRTAVRGAAPAPDPTTDLPEPLGPMTTMRVGAPGLCGARHSALREAGSGRGTPERGLGHDGHGSRTPRRRVTPGSVRV